MLFGILQLIHYLPYVCSAGLGKHLKAMAEGSLQRRGVLWREKIGEDYL